MQNSQFINSDFFKPQDWQINQQIQGQVVLRSVTVSAPGKLLLLGDHAVVYNRPCLVTAVDQRITVTLSPSDHFELVTPHVNNASFVSIAIDLFLQKYRKDRKFRLTTDSSSFNFGLGSSSAVTVATIAALAEFFDLTLSKREIFDLAYKVVLTVQGVGSGFDVAAASYGGTLYYVTGGKVIEPLINYDLPLVIGYTGVKSNTVALVKQVAEKIKQEPEKGERIFNAISKLVDEAKACMLAGDWERVGKLMDFNQEYLRDLGVSTEKLESLISAAKNAGAWGAKLSGAGGGDCMIALASLEKQKTVEEAIEKEGGSVIRVGTNAEGVKIES